MLDSIRLRAELFFVHRALNQVAAVQCKTALDELRTEASGTTAALIWHSLFADCLRVVHCALTADGAIYDFEIEGIRGLLTAAGRYYTGTPQSLYGPRTPVDLASARAFLDQYALDTGPFGRHARVRWRGHALCSRAAAGREHEPLVRYARLMWWLIDAACQLSGVSLDDPGSHDRLQDIHELRRALTSAGFGPQPEPDRRIKAFLSTTRVFTPVQQAISVSDTDPFDVELLHGEACASFQQLIEQATTEAQQASAGRTLLVIGDSGAGKTHLLRSFSNYVQEYGRGFVAYVQMYSSVDDYTRYILQHIVNSLTRPYAGPYGEHSGLYQLASGLALLKGSAFVMKVERLAELHGTRSVLDHHINELVDDLLGHPELAGFDPDLLRVLLYALCLDQKTTPRVYKYLRCEHLNDHDRSLIGNVAPRTAKEDPKGMIRSLARLAFVTRRATFVLMVDQAELSGLDSDQAVMTFQRAVDALLGIVSEVPSTVAVIACLMDLYDKAKKVLGRPTLDRIEKDPASVRLSSNRSFDEIKAIVGRRLAWLFAEAGAVYSSSDPVYPIPERQLRNLVNRRPRDILEWCQQFRERCIAANEILDEETPPGPEGGPPNASNKELLDQIAAAWNRACHAPDLTEPDRLDDIVSLVVAAANAYAEETGGTLARSTREDNMVRLRLAIGSQRAELVIAVTNRPPARGAFGAQIDSLRRAARDAIAVAVRTVEFPSGAVSVKTVTQLIDSGGRTIYLDSSTVRALVAYQRFQPAFAAKLVDEWRRRDRPISNMSPIARMFEIAPSRLGNEAGTASNGAEAHGNGHAAKSRTKTAPSEDRVAAPPRARKASRPARARTVAE